MKLKNMVLFSFLCMFIVPAAIILSIRYSTTDKIYEGLIENRLNDALEANEKAAESVFEVSRGVMRVVAEAAGMNVPPDLATRSGGRTGSDVPSRRCRSRPTSRARPRSSRPSYRRRS